MIASLMDMNINIPQHERRVVPDVNVYCAACPLRWDGECAGYGGEACPPCDRMAVNKSGDVTAEGEWIDAPIAEDSPTFFARVAGQMNTTTIPSQSVAAVSPRRASAVRSPGVQVPPCLAPAANHFQCDARGLNVPAEILGGGCQSNYGAAASLAHSSGHSFGHVDQL